MALLFLARVSTSEKIVTHFLNDGFTKTKETTWIEDGMIITTLETWTSRNSSIAKWMKLTGGAIITVYAVAAVVVGCDKLSNVYLASKNSKL